MIYAILIFGLLIFVHEMGHFIAAKAFGVKVHEFALGMGPAILKKQGKETLYAWRLIPIGGYVKMEGEDEQSEDERSFGKLHPVKKIIVLVAGAFMNVLMGFIFFVIIYSCAQQVATPVVDKVIKDSPAFVAGIREGDRVTEISGAPVHLHSDVSFSLYLSGGEECEVKVDRNGEIKTFHLTPVAQNGAYIIGYYPKIENTNFENVIYNSFYNTFFVVRMVFESLKMMITGQANLGDVSGPVGIVSEVSRAASDGWLTVLNFAALIAVNLGVMNLLPFPALDGGRTFFALIEAIRRKPLNPKIEGYIHTAGIMILLFFMVLVTFSDVTKLFG